MATTIDDIEQTISSISPLMKTSEVINIPADEDAFVAAYEANNDDLVDLATELQTFRGQLNTTIGQINTANNETENNANIASSVGNYQGIWSNSVTYSKTMGVSVGDLYYISKVDNNLNHTVTDTNYWTPSPANLKINTNLLNYTDKSTPVDADLIPLSDSAASFSLKKLSFANLKSNIINTTQTQIDTHLSVPTAYHIYNGGVSIDNTVVTNGFSTTLYTSGSATTNVDMDTQWGNDASERFGGLIWIKDRVEATNNFLYDTIRGATKEINSNTTEVESTLAGGLTAFNSTGFTVGADTGHNSTTNNMVSWNFQTTHRKTGVTNHGKSYTEHYNPYTGFTIIKYEGSGTAGHTIPHSLSRKFSFATVKNLSAATNWPTWFPNNGTSYAFLNLTNAASTGALETFSDTSFTTGDGSAQVNTLNQNYILYGWTNSYYDENNTLIGNYEVDVYQGTGVAGNKVTTRGKPAWVMVKRLDVAYHWYVMDNLRASFDTYLLPSASNAEGSLDILDANIDGFTVKTTDVALNASGGQYLYMVVYDNDSGSGKSKYPKATDTTNVNINALVPYSSGIDSKGSVVSISYKNQTISGLTLTQGKNYPYSKNDGTYGSKTIAPNYGITNPLTGDFFNLKTLKWYDNTNAEITPRTYLDCVVYADHNGQPTYVEELPKTTYFDEIKANDYKGKNACTAWVNFDGTTTPPTIRDSYNVASVVRTATGTFDIYFKTPMDNISYTMTGARGADTSGGILGVSSKSLNKISIVSVYSSAYQNTANNDIQIFGGKL